MKTNEKYMTNEKFYASNTEYVFAVYGTEKDYLNGTNAGQVMIWGNNNITKYEGQLILNGMAVGASVRYKHPIAAVYAITGSGTKTILSTSR